MRLWPHLYLAPLSTVLPVLAFPTLLYLSTHPNFSSTPLLRASASGVLNGVTVRQPAGSLAAVYCACALAIRLLAAIFESPLGISKWNLAHPLIARIPSLLSFHLEPLWLDIPPFWPVLPRWILLAPTMATSRRFSRVVWRRDSEAQVETFRWPTSMLLPWPCFFPTGSRVNRPFVGVLSNSTTLSFPSPTSLSPGS